MVAKNSFEKIKKIMFLGLLVSVIFSTLFSSAYAAQIFTSPSKSSVSVDETFRVRVGSDTLGKNINNAEATITFPTDLIQVLSIDSSSSIFNLWVTNPTFSNASGTITFNGGVSNPGFSGSNGTIFWITAKAKKPGSATFKIQDASVRANDGLGTNVISGVKNSTVSIVAITEKPKEVEKPSDEKDVVAPDILSATLEKNEKDELIVVFNARDNVGIEYFTIEIDGKLEKIKAINNSASYVIPYLDEGIYNANISAIDRAGNVKKQILVIPIVTSAPEITYVSKNIVINRGLYLTGISNDINEELIVVLVSPNGKIETYLVKTDDSGDFYLTTEALSKEGTYTVWAQKTELTGGYGNPSEKIEVEVYPTWLRSKMNQIKPYSPLIISGGLILIALFILFYKKGYRIVRVDDEY
jgi:hypothetical protein